MKLTMRRYQTEDDYWRMRNFLREVFLLNGRRQLSWHVAKLDYWRWHLLENCGACDPLESVTFIWETPDGRIAAALHPESRGEAFQQVHPRLRTPELEEEMLDVAERYLVHPERRKLWAFADSGDQFRQGILARRGFVKVTRPNAVEVQHRRWLAAPIPDAPPAPGYTVRALGNAVLESFSPA